MVIICVSNTNGSNAVQKEEEIKTNKNKNLMDDIVCATKVTFPPNSSCGEALSLSTECYNVNDKAEHSAVTARNTITGVVVGGGAGSLCHTRQSSPLFVLHLPTTPLNWSVISSSTFRFTRDPPSHQQTQDLYGTMVTASDVDSSSRGGTGRRNLLACYSGAHIKDVTTTISFRVKSNCSTSDNDSDDQSAMYKTIPFNKLYVDPIAQYKRNWGISTLCRLLGGGETTLASGNGTATAGWGNPGTTPVPASVTGTSNWNTNQLVDGQSPPNTVSNGPWQQSPQSSSTSSNNTSQTSNIGNKGQNSNSGSSSGNSTISTSQTTNNQQNTTSWAQAAGKNLPASSGPQVSGNSSITTTTASTTSGTISNPQSSNSPPTNGGNGVVNSSTKQQLEQINTMREALYSQDGWGGQHVNQDSQWEVPHSPEPNTKDGPLTGLTGGPGWSKVNNGTDLWEATLRNGGQPPLQIPVPNTSKTPWGHTPVSNIGGTWGEDDDVGSVPRVEENNSNWGINPTNTMSNQWGQGQPPPPGPSGPMWGGPPKKDIGPDNQSWNSGNTAWNDLNRPPGSIDQGPHRRDILPNGIDHSRGIGSDAIGRGGISGRLNGTLTGGGAGMEPMWGGPPPHHMQHHVQPPSVGPPPSVIATPGSKLGQGPVPVINQWSGPPPPKDINAMNNNNKGNGWEEPSPTDHRRNLLNYDDGTSLWGNTQTRPNVPGGGLLGTQHNMNKHWGKADMAAAVAAAAAGRNNSGSSNMGNQCPPGVPPNRAGMPPTNKMADQQLWPGNPRNGTWGDVGGGSQHDLNVAGPWGEDKMGLSGNTGGPWPNSEWGPGPKSKNSWGDCSNNEMDPSSWGQKNIGQKNQNKEYIWQSKSYRILAEMGVKKEDVEAVTRSYNISMEEAIEYLMSTRGPGGGGLDSWNSHGGRGQHPEDQNPFDRSNINQQRFNSQQLPFAVPSIGNNSNQQQVMLQKLLAQQPPTQQNSMQQQYSQGGGSRQIQNQPTAQQLRMLVQQIQMAVQAGYLNHQILNQPLAPQTLIMLNQLLQQIKILQQNVQIQAAVANNPKSGPAMVTAAIAINKARQQIASLQNQIANNQAMHMKAQAHQNQSNFSGLSGLMGGQVGDFFKNDPLTLLQSGFSDLAMNKDPQISGQAFQTSQQSRLNQWKLPNKDDLGMGNNEFSRAPGANSKSTGNTSPSFNSLLSQGDGTWTNVGAHSDSGWPDNEDNKEGWPNGSNSQSNSASSAFATDLVPEFEPGKPWKGNQIKNIEDDPTITPGSVVRSPLSLAATIKDSNNSDLFNSGGKTSPTNSQSADMPLTPLSLSSSTWSFNPPPSSTQSSFSSPLGKVSGPKHNWAESNPGNDLWGGVLGSSGKSRGPPPGLTGGSNKTGNTPNNGWPRWPSNNTLSWQSSSNNLTSTWLLLRNLTQQIDGSTLKTLCIQHGPLLNFHMYLNHGIALAKYSTREEASKAQGALNNCVLSNTTIFAESPTDAEVQMLLTHLSGGGGGSGSGNNSSQQQSNWNNGRNGNGNSQGQQGSDTWANSQLWGGNNSGPPGNTSSLWGAGADQIDPHRTTPSSLNSFMPGDLLGSETM